MGSVALVRPVWWIACRSVRFVTALLLMALLLGTAGAGGGLFSPSRTVAAPPAVVHAEQVVAGQESAAPGSTVADVAVRGDAEMVDGPAAAVVTDPAAGVAAPEHPAAAPGEARPWVIGDGYADAAGPRAPPRR